MHNLLKMKILITTIFISIFSVCAIAQQESVPKKNLDTATFSVAGICEMCQKRIENAAYIKGVKKVNWQKENHQLTVIYKPKKVSPEKVAKSIAKAGHDNEYFKAQIEFYNKIHHCCKYREHAPH